MAGSLGETLSDYAYRAGWAAVRLAPEGLARRTFDAVGSVAGKRKGGPEQLRKNLARVIGTTPAEVPEELMVAAMQSYARYWREAFRLPSTTPQEIVANVRMDDGTRALLDDAVGRGRGVVFALPHKGNWDLQGVWLVETFGRFSTVAERLKPESLFERFVEYRESLGFEVFPLTGGQEPPFPILEQRLRDGGLVCLLGDRDLSKRGVPVTFFGEPTRMPAGPAKLAQATGAALLVVDHRYDSPSTSRIVLTEVDTSGSVAEVTQRVAKGFEAAIAGGPQDWHMLQPLWEADWSAERRARLT